MKTLTILGATGSIGRSTLDVVARHPERFRVFALTAHRQIDVLIDLCAQHGAEVAVVPNAEAAMQAEQLARARGIALTVLHGEAALCTVAAEPRVNSVMAAIVGAAGLSPVFAAARAGKQILLANKEALVMAGQVLMHALREYGGQILPVDSEHNAIFQCLPINNHGQPEIRGVKRLLLTASGGPFRQRSTDTLHRVTPEEACAHPNWVMGRKISVDSATMMNKGLEVIEAHWLFGLPAEQIEVLIHPQSVVHSLVEYHDGSVLAQLGQPDMRTPIAHVLSWPERMASGVSSLDLLKTGLLTFEAPDAQRFPCLNLAYEALRSGGAASIWLNAANEMAVQAFLDKQISYLDITRVLRTVLNDYHRRYAAAVHDLDDILAADNQARQITRSYLTVTANL